MEAEGKGSGVTAKVGEVLALKAEDLSSGTLADSSASAAGPSNSPLRTSCRLSALEFPLFVIKATSHG